MSIVQCVRDFIMKCPFLNEGKINVDYLGLDVTEYSIDAVPAETVIKKYIDGSSERQFLFNFASIEYYGADVIQNIDNSGFYERFAKWLDDMSSSGELPEMPEGTKPIKIEALSSGYMFDSNTDTARYQIQCRLLYYQN